MRDLIFLSSESLRPLKRRDVKLECLCLTAPVCCSTASPNKIVPLQWAGEDKFGFSSSFHLFDAFITKGQKAGNGSLGAARFVREMSACICGIFFFLNSRLFSLPSEFLASFGRGNPLPTAKFSCKMYRTSGV